MLTLSDWIGLATLAVALITPCAGWILGMKRDVRKTRNAIADLSKDLEQMSEDIRDHSRRLNRHDRRLAMLRALISRKPWNDDEDSPGRDDNGEAA